MSIISPRVAPPDSSNAIGIAACPQCSLGRWLVRAMVILIGIAVGWFIAVVIGLFTGWIRIDFC